MMFLTIRQAYQFLQFEKKLAAEGKITSLARERVAITIKREIREKLREHENRHTFCNDYDGAWFKYPLPEWIQDRESAIRYFETCEYIEYQPSQYDCTGRQFTAAYKVFQKPNGRWWCYHRISADV